MLTAEGKTKRIQTLQTTLAGYQFKRAQQPFDPNVLPNRSLTSNPDNKPKTDKESFTQAGLHNTPYIQLAALGDFTFDWIKGVRAEWH